MKKTTKVKVHKKTSPKLKVEEPKEEEIVSYANHDRSGRELSKMRRKDLQLACVVRGLDFEKIPAFDQLQLISWFQDNYEKPQNHDLIALYDVWVDQELEKRGYPKGVSVRHPIFNLGIVPGDGNWDKQAFSNKPDKPKKEQVDKPRSDKPKKERNESLGGLYMGTKKEMTFRLAKEGKSYDEIVKLVTTQFPDANAKSIKIWMGRSKKAS